MEIDKKQFSIADILSKNSDIPSIKSELIGKSWKETNFGFQLGRKTGALDIQKVDERLLIFNSPPLDQINYQTLQQVDLPHFNVKYFYSGQVKIGVADIPPQARALDSVRYPEQQQTTGYLGAYEILGAAAELIGKIANKTSTTLPLLRLDKLSLIVGGSDIIKIIPPLELQPFLSEAQLIENLAGQLLKDLQDQDPLNNHLGQVQYFKYKLQRSLNT